MSRASIRVLVSGAGTGASANLIRALQRMNPPPYVVGVNHDRFTLKQSMAERNYVCPPASHIEFAKTAAAIVRRERLTVVMPTDDDVVKALSDGRHHFSIGLYLPSRAAVDLCHDKHA